MKRTLSEVLSTWSLLKPHRLQLQSLGLLLPSSLSHIILFECNLLPGIELRHSSALSMPGYKLQRFYFLFSYARKNICSASDDIVDIDRRQTAVRQTGGNWVFQGAERRYSPAEVPQKLMPRTWAKQLLLDSPRPLSPVAIDEKEFCYPIILPRGVKKTRIAAVTLLP